MLCDIKKKLKMCRGSRGITTFLTPAQLRLQAALFLGKEPTVPIK
jgi:hypothetical protein